MTDGGSDYTLGDDHGAESEADDGTSRLRLGHRASSALGTIEDDDPVIAVVSADAASVDEGDDAVFTVTLSGGTRAADVVVDYTVSGAGRSDGWR